MSHFLSAVSAEQEQQQQPKTERFAYHMNTIWIETVIHDILLYALFMAPEKQTK